MQMAGLDTEHKFFETTEDVLTSDLDKYIHNGKVQLYPISAEA